MDEPLVWYAGYGSNLRAGRLAAYLSGGRPPGSGRHHPGARDPRPPLESRTCTLPGRIRFRGSFHGWGEGGGAAFWEPEEGRTTWCRAYRLRAPQLADLALQENGHDPGAVDAATLDRVDRRVADLAGGDEPATVPLLDAPGAYTSAVRVTARDADDTPLVVVTLTAPSDAEPPEAAPPVAYVSTILDGLIQDVGLHPEGARRYLLGAGVPAEVLHRVETGR